MTDFNTQVISDNLTLLQLFLLIRNESTNTFLVGGCVRDLLLGKTPKDFDLVTDVDINNLAPILTDNGWEVKFTGQVFGILFVSKNGQQFEIANFRKDSSTTDGRRPDSVEVVSFDNIIVDARRRDFSINSLYLEPFTGNVIDPTGDGISDLNNRILRFNGNAYDRIREDYLRVWRFFRFLTRGFVPDTDSLNACRSLFNLAHTSTAPERVRIEIEGFVNIKPRINSSVNVRRVSGEVSDCNTFIVCTNTNTFSFNDKVFNIVQTRPIDFFRAFQLINDGYVPSNSMVSNMRQYFRTAYNQVCPNLLLDVFESIIGTSNS